MLVTVAGFKGGVGKTTTAVHLACYLAQMGSVLLVDADPNRSASGWAERGEMPFTVMDADEDIDGSAFDHVVIDTAARPADEIIEAIADSFLVLPTSCDALAIDALMKSIAAFESVGADRYRVLLTMIDSRAAGVADDAREALADFPVFKRAVRRFRAYEKAALAGVPVFEVSDARSKIAWKDYVDVGKELWQQVEAGRQVKAKASRSKKTR